MLRHMSKSTIKARWMQQFKKLLPWTPVSEDWQSADYYFSLGWQPGKAADEMKQTHRNRPHECHVRHLRQGDVISCAYGVCTVLCMIYNQRQGEVILSLRTFDGEELHLKCEEYDKTRLIRK